MKNRTILTILGIMCILTTLFIALPASPISAVVANTITASPTQGAIGDEITVHGEFAPFAIERWGIIYMSPSDLAVGTADITSAPSYKKVVNAVYIPPQDSVNSGIFNAHFNVPSVLNDGTVSLTVVVGSYFLYATTMGPSGESKIAAKTTFTVSNPLVPVFDPLDPTSGPPGSLVTVSGSNFPVSTALAYKFDTTTLTPTSGDTSTGSTGSFESVITIPPTASFGTHTIFVTAGSVSANATFTVLEITPTIILLPATGAAGSSVTVNGVNYPATTALTIRFDATILTITSGSTATTAGGTFSSVVTIPSSATVGAHNIFAAAGTGTDSETFTVTGPSITPLNISPNNGPVGQSVSISGGGFIVDQSLTVTWDGVATTTTGTVLAGGVFVITYTIPAAIHGAHTIGVIVTGGTGSASGTFTIESTPPATPQPERPYMDEAVSSPVTFEWADVTDPSAPVTYKLQISASADFTTNIINLTGLTASTYTLTENDLLSFTAGQTYYWREKAVDAAQNESAWTGANSFSISQGFSFVGWPLYLTIGLAAVLLFLAGIWLGRKTAYTY